MLDLKEVLWYTKCNMGICGQAAKKMSLQSIGREILYESIRFEISMCGCFRRKKGMNSFMKDSFNPAYSFVPNEEKVLEFWEQNKSFEALRKKNAKGKKYRFIDGPITANNPMGVHHAWGRTLKDVFLRYKAMEWLSEPLPQRF